MMEEQKLDSYSDIIFQQGELMNKHIKSFDGKVNAIIGKGDTD